MRVTLGLSPLSVLTIFIKDSRFLQGPQIFIAITELLKTIASLGFMIITSNHLETIIQGLNMIRSCEDNSGFQKEIVVHLKPKFRLGKRWSRLSSLVDLTGILTFVIAIPVFANDWHVRHFI